MNARTAAFSTVLLGFAVLLGVGAADGWRVHPALLGTLASLQAVWGLGAFVAGRSSGRTEAPGGAIAGALFGGAAITSYYVYEWLAYGATAATSQLNRSGGVFWCLAAVIGGALMGTAGALSGRRATTGTLQTAPVAWSAAAAVCLSEAVFMFVQGGWFPSSEPIHAAAASLALLTVGLLIGAARQCGIRPVFRAAAAVAVVTPLLAIAFFTLEHRVGYVTL